MSAPLSFTRHPFLIWQRNLALFCRICVLGDSALFSMQSKELSLSLLHFRRVFYDVQPPMPSFLLFDVSLFFGSLPAPARGPPTQDLLSLRHNYKALFDLFFSRFKGFLSLRGLVSCLIFLCSFASFASIFGFRPTSFLLCYQPSFSSFYFLKLLRLRLRICRYCILCADLLRSSSFVLEPEQTVFIGAIEFLS